MLIRNCAVKRLPDSLWLHHTASGYKVKINDATLAVLRSVAARPGTEGMTKDERFIYDKLAAKGMAGEDSGREEDRLVPLKEKSPLDLVDIELSGRCNLRCGHCFAPLSGKDMEARTLAALAAGLDALEPSTLSINGGEPLLNPLLPEAIRMARARHMRVNLMTNGTLATEETAAMLRELGLALAVVSLDMFEDSHDAIRGAGAFGKAVAGIRRLVAAKVPVSVTAMVQDSSFHRVREFTDFCLKDLGASGIRFASVSPIGNAKDAGAGLQLSPERTKELFSSGLMAAPGEPAGAAGKLPGGSCFSCRAGVGQCFIGADGRMYACHFFQNLGESMGNLAERSMEAVYRDYQRAGEVATTFDWGRLSKCRACAHFKSCLGGCRARARLIRGGWYEPDPHSCDIHGVPR